MAVIGTLAQTNFSVGTVPITSSAIAATPKRIIFKLQQVGWAHNGTVAFNYLIEVSSNNGANYTTVSSGNVYDMPIAAKAGRPANQIWIVCSMPSQGLTTRLARITFTFAKAVTMSGTIEDA